MIDFEGILREMSLRGETAICVPAAFKDAGISVPQETFIQAALRGSMDYLEIAEKLGLKLVDVGDLSLQKLYDQFQ